MKTFEYKVYDLDGTFKITIKGDKIKNNINFTSGINGPQGQCNIGLNYDINDTLGFSISDIIKVYAFDDDFPNGKLIYTGQIQVIDKNYLANEQSIDLTVFGLGTLLNNLIFQSGGSQTFTKNQDPAQTVKDIIDYFNSIYTYGWLNYDGTSIVNYGSSISIDFNFTNCFQALKNIQDATQSFYFYIHNDGKVYYRSNIDSNNILYKPTAEISVQSIQIKETIENLANFGYITYSSGNTSYSDGTSISNYGRVDNYQNQTNIGDSGSATTFITDFINKNKDISEETTIILNNKFNNGGFIEDIKPGDRITILNFNGISNKQIVKVSYTPTLLTINLENYISLNKVLFN